MKNTITPAFYPENDLVYVDQTGVSLLPSENISVSNVGGKAYGLCCVPSRWTLPFFVISNDLASGFLTTTPQKYSRFLATWESRLLQAAREIGLKSDDNIIIRSSGHSEGLLERGEYYSEFGQLDHITDLLKKCLLAHKTDPSLSEKPLFFIIQKHVALHTKKGHLSNERRCYKESRDWLVELESSSKPSTINLRKWREVADVEPWLDKPLKCIQKHNLISTLEIVATWAYKAKIRVHFEWVWDGDNVFVVQADKEQDHGGIDPTTLVTPLSPETFSYTPQYLDKINPSLPTPYRKLNNVHKYNKLGLPITSFYILKGEKTLKDLAEGKIPDLLRTDLATLVKDSLVIRMDIISEDKKIRQLLPRTNEVRDIDSAIEWLTKTCKKNTHLFKYDLAFLFHNFIPAAISVFAYAEPSSRKVLVEALWGLPEGLYYNSHDKYIVDTKSMSAISLDENKIKNFSVSHKTNYKHYIVAPDAKGRWITQVLHRKFDWRETIKDNNKVKMIAYESRRIAAEEGRPLSIMWFVDVDTKISSNSILPWHHEPFSMDYTKTSHHQYRSKTPFDEELIIRTKIDLDKLKAEAKKSSTRLRWISIQPNEDELLRDKDILKTIGTIAKSIDATIFLQGGTLSHAYYQLSQTEAKIQVAHEFREDDEKQEFNKLVRDKIPDKITSGGETVQKAKFTGDDLIHLLKEKLVEESIEVLDSPDRNSIIEELADVSEVIDSILEKLGADRDELHDVQRAKHDKAGGFREGFVLLETTNPLLPPLQSNTAPLFAELGIDEITAKDVKVDFHELEKRSSTVKRWQDQRKHNPESESILAIDVPLIKSNWSVDTPTTFLDLAPDFELKIKATGNRKGNILRIRLSLYTLPKQFKLI